MSTRQTGRIREWDYWRAMALLSVVVIHVTGDCVGWSNPLTWSQCMSSFVGLPMALLRHFLPR